MYYCLGYQLAKYNSLKMGYQLIILKLPPKNIEVQKLKIINSRLVRIVKPRMLWQAEYVTQMTETRNTDRVLEKKLFVKQFLWRMRQVWEDNIKTELKETCFDNVKQTELVKGQRSICFSGAEHLGCYTRGSVISLKVNLAH